MCTLLLLLVCMIASVDAGEAFEIGRAPVVLALEQIVHFALGCGSRSYSGRIGGASSFDGLTRCRHELFLVFDGFLECFDAGVASQIVEALRGGEDVGLDMVHQM